MTDTPSKSADSRFRRTRRDHASETAEDYVEAIAKHVDSRGECRGADLAREFGVSHVTVTKTVSRLQAEGHLLIGGALLGDDGGMIGSAAVAEFDSREALDEWLRTDPYVTGDVWRDIEVLPYRVAPHYDFGQPKKAAAE